MRRSLALAALAALLSGCAGAQSNGSQGGASTSSAVTTSKAYPEDAGSLGAEEWKEILTAQEYRVLRQAGTELAFSGEYWDEHRQGVYRCAGCGQLLFHSKDKFDSGTGWPSYTRPVSSQAVDTEVDTSHGMTRTEALCSNCGGHLGHVFDDGPAPTGKRWCINSVSLDFEPGI